ncbi:hypothetical protein [Streptomyces sp. NPDC101115]|uniref:hypothetical protein n=1 Tax=Streptomyces sp. NPDC101115 TaxID=3366106 RepID=UPI0037FEBC1F
MSTDKPATGPIPIYVRTLPAGVVLDLEALTRLVVGDVLDALLDGDSTDLWDQLLELASPGTAPTPEDRLPYESLVSELTERASSRVPLYGTRALELADQLMRAGRLRGVPGPRDRRAS